MAAQERVTRVRPGVDSSRSIGASIARGRTCAPANPTGRSTARSIQTASGCPVSRMRKPRCWVSGAFTGRHWARWQPGSPPISTGSRAPSRAIATWSCALAWLPATWTHAEWREGPAWRRLSSERIVWISSSRRACPPARRLEVDRCTEWMTSPSRPSSLAGLGASRFHLLLDS